MKIILHGGYAGHWDGAGEDVELFDLLISQARKADGKLLISFLAQDKKEDFPYLNDVKNYFSSQAPDVKLTVCDRLDFLEHLAHHQVLFMQGGNSLKQEAFHRDVLPKQITENKACIAGSSSGAMMIAHHGISSHNDGVVVKGHSLLNIAIIPHANDWPLDLYMPKVKAHKDCPILCLDENQIVVFEQ